MNSILISTDFVASLFIVVILIGLYEIPAEAIKATRHFRRCMWIVFIGLIIECLAMILDGKEKMSFLLLLLNYAGYVLLDLLTIIYSFYLNYLIEESERRFTKVQANVITCLLSIDICILTVGMFTGKLFTVTNGYLTYGPWSDFTGMICSLCFFAMCLLYLFKYKAFRIRSKFFVVLIVVVPLAATIIGYIYPNSGFGFLGAAVSMNVVYVILESKIIAESCANAKMYNEISEKDLLTGLKNRRGYQKVIDGIADDDRIGIVFADANSLKEVNDNKGHEAGDKLIIRIANILKDAVPDWTVCRISGDEFVCIKKNPDTNKFTEMMTNLEEIFQANNRVAAFGYETGSGKDVYSVIKSAEKKMYSDKHKYYMETGKDRRR